MPLLPALAKTLVGTWLLAGAAHESGEVTAFHDSARRHTEIVAWLDGDRATRVRTLRATQGLTLVIDVGGHFTETRSGDPDTLWYDADGVEELQDPTPFSGDVVARGGHTYLRPDMPNEAWQTRLKREERLAGIALRIDDGDTLIADRIERDDDDLVRTVSVVTDEAYFSRVVLRYTRAVP